METDFPQVPRTIDLAGCRVDFGARTARWPDGDRSLTPTETKLLAYLVSMDGRVVSQRDLLREVWGYRGGVVSRTVKTTMGRLRAKVERDPGQPDHLLTVVGAGYRFEPGDPRPSEATVDDVVPTEAAPTRVDLPEPRGPVVGRAAAVDEITARLTGASPLVTVTGPAGVGKSTVALEAARRLAEGGDLDQVQWCELGTCVDEGDVVRTIAARLGLELVDERRSSLADALPGRGRVLLVLDDAERAIQATRDITETLLARCSDARLLVTSREVLGLPAEPTNDLQPLGPEPATPLFTLRAGEDALPGYAEPDRLGPVLERLDGLPLAIELAASWASFLSPEDLASRLDHQLDLLESGRASLRATIASSWALLSDRERAAAIQLSVFAGAAPVDAIDSVIELPDGSPPLAAVRRLCQRSLARRVDPPGGPGTGSPWIRLYESVKQFALEQEPDPGATRRHVAWCAWLGDPDALEALDALGGVSALDALSAARADLEVATPAALDAGDVAGAAACLRALLAIARLRGPVLGWPDLYDRTMGAEMPPDLRVPLLRDRAGALISAGHITSAGKLLDEADRLRDHVSAGDQTELLRLRAMLQLRVDITAGLESARAAGRHAEAGGSLIDRARCAATLGALLQAGGREHDAHAQLTEALELARGASDRRTEALVLEHLGRHAFNRGRPMRALSLFKAALDIAQVVGDRPLEATMLHPVATLNAMLGQLDEAERTFTRAIELTRELGHRGEEGRAHSNLGGARLQLEDYAGAREHLSRALQIALELGDPRLELTSRGHLGALLGQLGRHAEAIALLDRSIEMANELGLPALSAIFGGERAAMEFAEGRPEEGRTGMTRALKTLRDGGQRRAAQDLLIDWAEREADVGEHERAEQLLEEANREAELSMADGPASLIRP